MKLLLDACVSVGAARELESAGGDVEWAGRWPEDPGEEAILARAHQQGRILVTLDKDFGELVILRRQAHGGIVRLAGFSARSQAAACLEVLVRHGESLQQGALVTAERGRLRIRPPTSEESASQPS